jgi:hypothetical protein
MGAAGVAVVASAFFLGGRLAASDATPAPATALTAEATSGLQLECEPGQRAVLRQTTLACVGAPAVPAGYTGYVEPFTAAPSAGYVQTVNRPAVVTRSAPVQRTSTARAPVTTKRSTKKSVAIIAGSTAAGAVVGGVAKGKKGAVIGGIVGGAAATIWDQATRNKQK